jgi:hypothetical protein
MRAATSVEIYKTSWSKKPESEKQLARCRHRWKDNSLLKMDLKGLEFQDME